jgi:hypothetical protein
MPSTTPASVDPVRSRSSRIRVDTDQRGAAAPPGQPGRGGGGAHSRECRQALRERGRVGAGWGEYLDRVEHASRDAGRRS